MPPGRRHHCRSKAKRSRHHQTPQPETPCYVSHPSPVPSSGPWPPPPATTPFPAVVQPYPLPMFSPRGGPQPLPPAPTSVPPATFPSPLVTPMVALVLPNYLFPAPPSYPYGISQVPAEGPPTPSHSPSPSLPPLAPSPPHRPDSPLFNSRCSSPLQLNLLQLEESPRTEGGAAAGGPGSSAGPLPPSEEAAEPEARLVSNKSLFPLSQCPQPLALFCLGQFSASWNCCGWEVQAEFVSGAEISCLLWEGTVLSDRWQGHHSVHQCTF